MESSLLALPSGVTFEYALTGPAHAPALVFVHGVGANRRQFDRQHETFGDTHRVLSLSLRGHGRTTAPARPTSDDYTIRALSADVLAFLDALVPGRVHFVGNSLGGLIGLQILRERRHRLQSLTTFGTTAELHAGATLRLSLRLMTHLLGPRGLASLLAKTASQQRDVATLVAEMMRSVDPHALVLVQYDIADYDYTDVLRRDTPPLLLIRGELDREINAQLGSTLQALAANPVASVQHLDGAGHYANLDNPRDFDLRLRAFLNRVQRPESEEVERRVNPGRVLHVTHSG